MVRSPIFLFFLLLLFSCKPSTTPFQEQNTANAIEWQQKGMGFLAQKTFDSSFFYFNKSKIAFQYVKDNDNTAYNLIQMAYAQQTFGDYYGSEETLTEALMYTNDSYKASVYNFFGIAAKELSNYNDAIRYYNEALKNTSDPVSRQSPLNNMAAVYIQKKQYTKAIQILESILESQLLDTLPDKKARIIDNLGFAYFKEKQLQKGLKLLQEGLTIRKQAGDSYGCIESYLHLASYYQNNNIKQSINNALLAYTEASKHQSIDERLEALGFLMAYNQQQGKNHFANQFLHLNDSITRVRNNAKTQFAKIKYDSRVANEKSIKYKSQAEKTALGIIALFVIAGLTIFHINQHNKFKQRQTVYTTETRIAKKLHDELANDVFHTMTFAETQDLQNPAKKEILLTSLNTIYNSTRNISRENSSISTNVDYEDNLKQMLNSYKTATVNVIIKNLQPIHWANVTREKKIALYRVLQEFMVNMKKHSQANFVIIGLNEQNKHIVIDYYDNGVGRDETTKSKNGLQNAENRIRAIKGTLTFETAPKKGFKAIISFPK